MGTGLFAEQMQEYGRKTFAFETDTTGYAKVHHVTGKFTDTYYHSDTYHKVVTEVAEQFDTSRDVFLIAVDVSSEFINNEGACGIGGGGWQSYDNELWRRDFGGTAVIPASGVCINPSITAHELGHVFGLEHDFRDDAYLMPYGTQERLSDCAAELPEPVQPRDVDTLSVVISIGCNGAYLCDKWQSGAAFVIRASSYRYVSWQESCRVLGRQKPVRRTRRKWRLLLHINRRRFQRNTKNANPQVKRVRSCQ